MASCPRQTRWSSSPFHRACYVTVTVSTFVYDIAKTVKNNGWLIFTYILVPVCSMNTMTLVGVRTYLLFFFFCKLEYICMSVMMRCTRCESIYAVVGNDTATTLSTASKYIHQVSITYFFTVYYCRVFIYNKEAS